MFTDSDTLLPNSNEIEFVEKRILRYTSSHSSKHMLYISTKHKDAKNLCYMYNKQPQTRCLRIGFKNGFYNNFNILPVVQFYFDLSLNELTIGAEIDNDMINDEPILDLLKMHEIGIQINHHVVCQSEVYILNVFLL